MAAVMPKSRAPPPEAKKLVHDFRHHSGTTTSTDTPQEWWAAAVVVASCEPKNFLVIVMGRVALPEKYPYPVGRYRYPLGGVAGKEEYLYLACGYLP